MTLAEKCQTDKYWMEISKVVQECEFSSTPIYVVCDNVKKMQIDMEIVASYLGYLEESSMWIDGYDGGRYIIVNRMPIHIVSKQDKINSKDVVYIEESS